VPRSELPPTEFVADDAKMLSMAIACQCLLPSPLLDDRVVRSKQDLCHLSTQTCRIVLRLFTSRHSLNLWLQALFPVGDAIAGNLPVKRFHVATIGLER